jgi:hypothetical protein
MDNAKDWFRAVAAIQNCDAAASLHLDGARARDTVAIEGAFKDELAQVTELRQAFLSAPDKGEALDSEGMELADQAELRLREVRGALLMEADATRTFDDAVHEASGAKRKDAVENGFHLICLKEGLVRRGDVVFKMLHAHGRSTYVYERYPISEPTISGVALYFFRKYGPYAELHGLPIHPILTEGRHAFLPEVAPQNGTYALLGDPATGAGGGIYMAGEDRFLPYAAGGIPEGTVALHAIAAPFCNPEGPAPRRALARPWNVAARGPEPFWYGVDAMEVYPTPALDSIFETQGLGVWDGAPTRDIVRHIYGLLGRCLFPLGTHDKWQVIPFFSGVAGTGKSTIGTVMTKLFPAGEVGIISNKVQENFGLEDIFNKCLFMAKEVKSGWSLDQGMFQSMISGEEVAVGRKYKLNWTGLFTVPGLLFGNERLPYQDAAGSIARRIAHILFTMRVQQKDNYLDEKLQVELPAILRKLATVYLQMVAEIGGDDVWTHLHPYFRATQANMRKELSAIHSFLDQGMKDSYERDPTGYVRLKDFKTKFKAFKQDEDFHGRTDDVELEDALASVGLSVQKVAKHWPTNAETPQLRLDHYVIGIRPIARGETNEHRY